MNARRQVGVTGNVDRLTNYGGTEEASRPSDDENREAAARWTEARRKRLGRTGEVDLAALRDGRMGRRGRA